jgi:hypothetical protein
MQWQDGYIIPPTEPGIGVELDEAVAAAHPYEGQALHLDMLHTMQCYEYLAIQYYARRHLGEWTGKLDDLELAEALDEQNVETLRDARRLSR